jgi:hypothetical protein
MSSRSLKSIGMIFFILFPQIVLAGNMYMYYGPYKHSKTYERQHRNDFKFPEPEYPEYDGWGNLKDPFEAQRAEEDSYESTKEEGTYEQDTDESESYSPYAEEAGCTD